eukprot:TRINITY_DN21701_c0_g3_i1.p1 TRINITY_DN21701_c0_g3~~TRINITY_DN21701_c0_g3_i1.p1  ORF type:complete len:685 (+),score=81.99 TRINITY_DN21701_c0_g3_i1:214-2268(+)
MQNDWMSPELNSSGDVMQKCGDLFADEAETKKIFGSVPKHREHVVAAIRQKLEVCIQSMFQESVFPWDPESYVSDYFKDSRMNARTLGVQHKGNLAASDGVAERKSSVELEEPEVVDMCCHEQFKNKSAKKQAMSYACFHTGTTTSVKRTTIRITPKYHVALVMEADTGECFVAISKAQGCDSERIQDPNFIGWVRLYSGCFSSSSPKCSVAADDSRMLSWNTLDDDIASFLEDVSTCEDAQEPFDDSTLKDRLSWRMLLMQPRKNDKGMWSYVYVAQVNGKEYTLLNKGVRVLQTSLLETWNPPRAKSVSQDEKTVIAWMWFDGDVLYFTDPQNETYSVGFKELVITKHIDGESIQELIWMDKNGLMDPFSGKYFSAMLVEHIAGRKSLVLPVTTVTCRDESATEDWRQTYDDASRIVEQADGDQLEVSWRQERWDCKLRMSKRSLDGAWEIREVETTGFHDRESSQASVGMSFGEKTQLWFFTKEKETIRWWRCPSRVAEVLCAHTKRRRRYIRETEGAKESDDQATTTCDDAKVPDLVREIDDQSTLDGAGNDEGQATSQFSCWICGGRAFNARHQLVDHILGAGGGGKSHLKMRRRWIDSGQPVREDWLEILSKNNGDGSAPVIQMAQEFNGEPATIMEQELPMSSASVGEWPLSADVCSSQEHEEYLYKMWLGSKVQMQ